MADKTKAFRIIDVNLNRSKEGLRCCEEVTRFMLNDRGLTKALKSLRHNIEDITASSGISKKALCQARDTRRDCATGFCDLERKTDWQPIFFANIQRAKESLRVLEEFFKLFDEKSCEDFKALRFKAYELEKKFCAKYLK